MKSLSEARIPREWDVVKGGAAFVSYLYMAILRCIEAVAVLLPFTVHTVSILRFDVHRASTPST